MGYFSENLDLRWIGPINSRVTWELLCPLTYTSDSGLTITVPAGFRTDLASVPKVLWIWLPPDWKYTKAAVIHDYLLATEELPWDVANELFHECMEALAVNKQTNFIMYQAVCFWRWFKINFSK